MTVCLGKSAASAQQTKKYPFFASGCVRNENGIDSPCTGQQFLNSAFVMNKLATYTRIILYRKLH